MHPELRRARALYHEWRCMSGPERERVAPFAHDVKELALDLRGEADPAAAERRLALANDALWAMLRARTLRAA